MQKNATTQDLAQLVPLLQTVMDCTSEALFVKDLQGRYLFCNSVLQQIYGRSREMILNRDDFSLFDRNTAEAFLIQDRRVIESGQAETEERSLTVAGSIRFYAMTKSPYRDADGRVIGIIGTARDISAKKKKAAAFLRQQTILEAIARGKPLKETLENLVTMIEEEVPGVIGSFLLIDPDGKHLRVAAGQQLPQTYNEAIDGLEIGPMAGSCGTAVYRGESVRVDDIRTDPLWVQFSDMALSYGLRACWSIPICSRTNQPKTVLGTFAIYSTQLGILDHRLDEAIERIEYLACIALENHQILLDLQISESRFRTFVENTSDAFFLHSEDGKVLDVNSRACEYLGYSRDELMGAMPTLFDPFLSLEKQDEIIGKLHQGKSVAIETKHRRKDGQLVPVEVRLSPFEQGSERYSIAAVHDIAARKFAEERLRETHRQLLSIYETVADVIFLVALEPHGKYRFQSVNPAFLKCTGLPLQAVIDKRVDEVIPEPALSLVLKNYELAIRENRVVRWEETTCYPTGILIGDVSVSPIFSDEGQCTHLVGSVHEITARKHAENALRESEGRLAEAQRIAQIANWEWDTETGKVWCSDSMYDLLGFDRSVEPSFEMFYSRVHPEDLPTSLTQFELLQRGADGFTTDFRFTRPDGVCIWLQCRSKSIKDPFGKVLRIEGIDQDITERKNSDEELRESERRLAESQRMGRIGNYEIDLAQGTIWCSDAVYTLFGVEKKEPSFDNFFAMVHPEDLAESQALFVMLQSSLKEFSYDFRILRPDGTCIWFHSRTRPVFDHQGKVLRIEGTVQDITERKQAELILAESERRFRELANSIPQMVWSTDSDGTLTHLNEKIEEYTGIPGDQLIGWLWERVIHPADLPETRKRLIQIMEDGIPLDIQCRIRRADGEYRWHISRQRAIRDHTGKINCWYGTTTDVEDLMRAEEALRLARFAIDHATIEVYWTRADASIADVNQAACLSLGYTRDEMLLLKIKDIDHDYPLELWPEHWVDLRQYGTKTFQTRHWRKDGTIQEVEITAHLLNYHGEEMNCAFVRDITKQKQDERAIQESLSQLQATLESTADGILVVDLQGRIVNFNQQFLTLWNFPADLAQSGRNDNLVARFDENEAMHAVLRQLKDPEMFVTQVEQMYQSAEASTFGLLEFKDGKILERYSQPQRIDGKPVGRVLSFRNITERVRMEEERDRLWNYAPDPLCIVGFGGVFKQVNPAWTRIFGWSESELIGKSWLDFVHPDDVQHTIEIGTRMIQGEEVTGFENRYRCKKGAYRWLAWKAIPLSNNNMICGFARDVTEERKLAEQFRQAQKMEAIGRLAGGVAHDFNNLLTIINGYSEMMLSGMLDPAKSREFLSAIRDAGERAAGLTAQLLAFSRKAIVEPKILDLNQILEPTTRLLRRLIGEDIILRVQTDPCLGKIKADPGQIEQVIMNLLVNARDAMPNGGRLTIETRNLTLSLNEELDSRFKPGSYVQLRINDTGVGMSQEVKSKIFEPFFTTKEVGKGTGLGLAVVHGAIEQCGGQVEVESTVGLGTTITITFPAIAEPVSESAAGIRSPASQGIETVLLVEDEDAVRKMTRLALELAGFKVLEASRGAQAIRLVEQTTEPIHLLITDVVMPEMGGRQLAETLRKMRPTIRLLYMSGYTDKSMIHQGIFENEDAFLQKPFTPFALVRKARTILDRKTTNDQAEQ